MPILVMEEDEIDLTRLTVSSISGGVNYYELQPGEKDLDIMEFMFRKREEGSRIIQKHTHTQIPPKTSSERGNDTSEAFIGRNRKSERIL